MQKYLLYLNAAIPRCFFVKKTLIIHIGGDNSSKSCYICSAKTFLLCDLVSLFAYGNCWLRYAFF